MRPRELTLDGFRSYSGPTTISWEDRRLVGIVGPIGSGKSSILDGICFALYGRTPRLGAETRALINQRRDEGKVSFSFTVDGTEWKVVRALRRRGQSAHTLYRVEGGEAEEVSDKAREVTERVTTLLGLDYDGFRRSILLAQGDFAEFLLAKESERNQVLRGVFGFERLDAMREAARRRRDKAAAELAALSRLRERADQDRADLAGVRTEQEEAASEVARLEAAREPVAAAAKALSALAEEQQRLEAERAQMTELADRIPDREATERLLQAREQAAGRLAEAEQAAAAAAKDEAAAAEALERAADETGGRDALAEAGELLARLAEQQQTEARARRAAEAAALEREGSSQAADRAAAEVASAAAAAEEAGARVAAAVTARQVAAAAVHEATHRDLAAELRRGLADGDRCPVCEQQIGRVPPPAESGLDAARAEEEAATAALEQARREETKAARALAAAEAAADAATTARERAATTAGESAESAAAASAAVEATAAGLSAVVGDGDDPAALVAAHRERLDRAEAGLASARTAAAAAARAVEEARASAQESAGEASGLLTRLADLAGRLGRDVPLDPEPVVLREALAVLREAWVERVDGIDTRMGEVAVEQTDRGSERSAALHAAGLDAGADLDAAILAGRERKAGLDARAGDLAARLEDLTRLEAEQGELVAEHDRCRRLVDDLAPSKFPAYVLEDRRRALAALGSERFEYLSAGRYRFTDDGEFDVVDLTAADLTRSAASLSGGETFLASLALALALAEIVAREGGRLDAFFLDEGFGSLDPEHIDLAMAGIERLVTEGADRLIVVVSHVAGLRERIEDLIVLHKDEVTGDTAVRSGAAAG